MAFKLKKSDSLNIQSFIRIRPLEVKEKRSYNLECDQREVTIKSSSDFQKSSKSFLFDRVFEEDSKQVAVYSTVVRPMIKEVIQGYNCTVFAYGQTGTGKTYTMTGPQEDADRSQTVNCHAGIIPRALEDIFIELSNQSCEYQVSISFMELYNEKLKNLLSDSDDETNIQLIDDLEGGVILKGLSPSPAKSKNEAFKLLQKGTEKKQVAATLMNMNSSRSHTIFTINVNIKENALDKEDILRLGKLHLVDLAGSENVSKSGASEKAHKSATEVNRRLTEASNINKSLLTLGRVITSLTENNPHIPYRESKLTRLLRDSLGGKTKTCIIGTISPSHANMDESESTLNYVSKARSIKNKPEKNRTISSKEFMQSASEEMLKLKQDIELARQGNGYHISRETHEEMIAHMKQLDSEVKEWTERYDSLNASFEHHQELFSALRHDYDEKCAEYQQSVKFFESESKKLNAELSEISKEVVVRNFFIKEYKKREKNLTEDAKKYKTVMENVASTNNKLLDKISSKTKSEQRNIEKLKEFKHDVENRIEEFHKLVPNLCNNQRNLIYNIQNAAGSALDMLTDQKSRLKKHIAEFETTTQEKRNNLLNCKLNLINKINNESNSSVRDNLLKQINEVDKLKNMFDAKADQIKNELENLIEKGSINIDKLREIVELCKMPTHISQANKLYQDISQCLISKVHRLNVNIELAAKASLRSSESASTAYMKLQKLEEDLTELKSILKMSSSSTKECDDKMNYLRDVSRKIPEKIQKMADSKEAILFDQKLSEIQRSLSKGEEESVKMKSQLSNFTDKVQRNNSAMETGIQSIQECLKIRDNTHLEKKDRTLHTIKSFDTKLDKKIQVLSQESNQFCEELLEKLDDSVDIQLRKQSDSVVKHSQSISQLEELTLNKLGDLQQTVHRMQYSSDQPQGLTPQRVKMSDLGCPTQTASTGPVEALIDKFTQEQEIRSNAISEGNPDPTSSTQISTLSSELLLVLAKNSPMSSVEQSKRRLSNSMPNVHTAIENTEEDKENLSFEGKVNSRRRRTRKPRNC